MVYSAGRPGTPRPTWRENDAAKHLFVRPGEQYLHKLIVFERTTGLCGATPHPRWNGH